MDEQSEHGQKKPGQFHQDMDNRQRPTSPTPPKGHGPFESKQVSRSALRQIRTLLLDHLCNDSTRTPLGGVGIFHCLQPQAIRNVPIHQALVVLVVSGRKIIALGERRIEILPGELLLLPGGCTVEVGNNPGQRNEPYLGLAMAFPQESIERFRHSYGAEIPDHSAHLWRAPAPMDMLAAMTQWVEWCTACVNSGHPVDPALARHRQVEILMLLSRAGIAGNLLIDRQASWGDRVAQIITLDPSRDWSAGKVCQRLGVGESTLRRHLNREGVGFRQLLEECRMVAALGLLQETFWPVGQVAEAVGYNSHSSFSERFKRRFGLTPVELKKTRESNGEQKPSD